ncbi:sporulation protein [Streptomyces sp. AJS327]|uniref:sporulation protein n=1 Tax=Streptomyces sp. AJS327 TaxID=2545265 RepID=UPI0015DE3446|nr:sporulation protein [Streptomyces sp. AJS327]MBA0051672.1 sporulation protein [Streptomyces sp. AJS327]
MVFTRFLESLGAGGPAVDTVFDTEAALPGDTLSGEVRLTGGGSGVEVEHVGLELVARVEVEHGEGQGVDTLVFDQTTVAGGFQLARGETRTVAFGLTLPWETPVTELYGQGLGVVLGVRTEVAIDGARDRGDLDPLTVRPLPAQEAVLTALGELGFGFVSADVEYGRIEGTGQRLPFYQEVELSPSPAYAEVAREIEVTFLANPDGVEVVLEADKRAGRLSPGGDALARHSVTHAGVPHVDWPGTVDGWLRRLLLPGGTSGRAPAGGPGTPGQP